MRIEFDFTLEDRSEILRTMFQIDEMHTMLRRFRFVILASGLGILAVLWALTAVAFALIAGSVNSPNAIFTYILILCFAVYWAYRAMLGGEARRLVNLMLLDALKSQSGPGYTGRVAVVITDDALVLKDAWEEDIFRWPCVVKSTRERGIDFFFLVGGKCFMIPQHAFENEDHYAEFLAEIKQRNETAGGVSRLILAYLEENEHPCSDCGYELRAIAESICPECGRKILLEDFHSKSTDRLTVFDGG